MFRQGLLAASLFAICVGAITWLSGPDGFDHLDGNEFVICGRELGIPHPPGYPLFIFVLRTAAETLPGSTIDYDFYRMTSSFIAAAGYLAGVAVMMSFGAGVIPALLGSFLFFTSGPVLGQLNLVEIHGFGVLLVLVAILARRSRSGPYFFSLAVFGGHPLAFLLLPVVFTKRFRERWVLLAVIPATLVLFVPVRSMFPALSHYAYPSSLGEFSSYFTLYSTLLGDISGRVLTALSRIYRLVPMGILLGFVAISGRMKWMLLASCLVGMLFLSSYDITDTESMLWIIILPLSIWAAFGIDRLVSVGGVTALFAVFLVGISALLGVRQSWRAEDDSASIISRDMIRGIAPQGIFITKGFTTFCTAYLLEVEDLRPDIIPMDGSNCYFHLAPPIVLPAEMAGRPVYTNRAWNDEVLLPNGLLFSAVRTEVDWEMYDLFWMTGNVIDVNSRDQLASLWMLRGFQTEDANQRAVIWSVALNWAWSTPTLIGMNCRITSYQHYLQISETWDQTVSGIVTSMLVSPFMNTPQDTIRNDCEPEP